ncbi:ABC transporter permease [Derxia lacustris]|uniref:ABC transporter permease n=1 Tax=Derxia lacustris TaxID=764842 RepID=UPI000A172FBC|nr:ABC transporter permease [Derxia lacustris]
MSADTLIPIVVSSVGAATPLIYASLGELVVERSGVLNLGVEGMMLAGAIGAFAVTVTTGSLALGLLAGMACGMALAALFGLLTLTLQTNQVATGLALTLFGVGLSAFAGREYVGKVVQGMSGISLPVLSDLPGLGPLLFRYDLLVYGSVFLAGAVHWFLNRTRGGLIVRAAGESPSTAHAIGFKVIRIRYLAVLFGGAMSGLAGAYLSCALTPMWIEGMTAGRGWIALALVVFATWKPWRVLLGAYLFGGVTVLQFHAQGFGLSVPSEFLSMLPYLATIVVLVLICRDPKIILLNQPVSLGKRFHPDA